MAVNKKLIEVALPLDAINKASAIESSIRHRISISVAPVAWQHSGRQQLARLS